MRFARRSRAATLRAHAIGGAPSAAILLRASRRSSPRAPSPPPGAARRRRQADRRRAARRGCPRGRAAQRLQAPGGIVADLVAREPRLVGLRARVAGARVARRPLPLQLSDMAEHRPASEREVGAAARKPLVDGPSRRSAGHIRGDGGGGPAAAAAAAAAGRPRRPQRRFRRRRRRRRERRRRCDRAAGLGHLERRRGA